jgi:hypothetical protein
VHLVGFTVEYITMHGPTNVKPITTVLRELTFIFFIERQAIGQYSRATVGIYSEIRINYKHAV